MSLWALIEPLSPLIMPLSQSVRQKPIMHENKKLSQKYLNL